MSPVNPRRPGRTIMSPSMIMTGAIVAAVIIVVFLPPRAVTKEMLLNISDIIGRVLDGDKKPGYVFTDADFLPRGTREGLVAGIPAGKRAIRISAERVE